MTPFVLEDKIVRLSAPIIGDIPEIVEWCNDPDSMRYMPLPRPYGIEQAKWYLDNVVVPGWKNDQSLTWALRDRTSLLKPNGDFPALGTITIRTSTPERGALPGEVGFVAAPAARGKGLMSAALSLVLSWALSLDGLALPEAHWECVPGNLGSWRVAWKNGFIFDGIWDGAPGHTLGHWYGHIKAGAPLAPVAPWPAGAPI